MKFIAYKMTQKFHLFFCCHTDNYYINTGVSHTVNSPSPSQPCQWYMAEKHISICNTEKLGRYRGAMLSRHLHSLTIMELGTCRYIEIHNTCRLLVCVCVCVCVCGCVCVYLTAVFHRSSGSVESSLSLSFSMRWWRRERSLVVS